MLDYNSVCSNFNRYEDLCNIDNPHDALETYMDGLDEYLYETSHSSCSDMGICYYISKNTKLCGASYDIWSLMKEHEGSVASEWDEDAAAPGRTPERMKMAENLLAEMTEMMEARK